MSFMHGSCSEDLSTNHKPTEIVLGYRILYRVFYSAGREALADTLEPMNSGGNHIHFFAAATSRSKTSIQENWLGIPYKHRELMLKCYVVANHFPAPFRHALLAPPYNALSSLVRTLPCIRPLKLRLNMSQ